MIPFGPTVHVLRVSLRDVEPAVWRRLVVRSETPLPSLNQALERVMGWEGYHLHMFDVGGVLFGEPDEDADYVINEKAATVKHVLPRVGVSLRWDYDFGDGWEHDVAVEAIESPVDGNRYAVCLDGARACPPEDCGGTPGNERLLGALTDPRDPEHDKTGRVGAQRVRSGGVRPRRSEPKVPRRMGHLIRQLIYIWNKGATRSRLFQRGGTRLS